MNIVVCVKYVPDAQADRAFSPDDNTTDREVDGLLSELDEYPVEEALKLAEATDGKVIALTVGPDDAEDAVRKALQMGAHEGVHVLDDAIHGSDALATSKVLAAALGKLEFDLVLTGMTSTDGTMGVVPAMLAERLGLPQVTLASELTVADGKATIRRDNDANTEIVEAALPAVVSVTDQINEPRFPSFKGIMAAKKKPLQTWSLDDLGISADEVGLSAAWTSVADVTARPPRTAGQVVTDEGDGGTKLVEFLAGAKLV
ncbi:electron transfer flavoprotein subunit beta/FixA family protein [Kineosporia babensis]|uniref:Electron transfer flavoprotein subunit beta n=1 Tax=Kineosporia babensis TaxID=499548 RepID=A0A9X1SUX7_9ACTN|nr:electron transfer flavoprotein subunit beta/FixA family protein [Kineosporia babensis]MCD5312971.1 electron transfer flavoprotein subunit beta/FixA family protein [Kineosporia babensis]